MLKKLSALALAAVLVLSMNACGTAEGTGDIPASSEITESEAPPVSEASSAEESSSESAAESRPESTVPEAEAEAETEAEAEPESGAAAEGIRPEFKAAMDSYEEFFTEYAEFMDQYENSSDTASMLVDYMKFNARLLDLQIKLEEMDEDEMTDEELAYYLDVSTRIAKLLIDSAA